MKASLTLLMKLFPFWGTGLVIVCAELAIFYRRRESRHWKVFVTMGGGIALFVLLWLVFRGDLHSADWINSLDRAFNY
jgi:hypothetical protein